MSSKIGLLLAAALVMCGCATNRGSMSLKVTPASVTTTAGTPVFIDEIHDNRVFEDKPGDPSIPSLKGGSATSESAEIKAKAIARKRNSFGRAMGDILLEGNQTVVDVMRDLLRQSFTAAGYTVVDDRSKLGNSGIEVDADIEKFWAWFTPGMWSVTMESKIETALHVTQNGEEKTVDIRAYGKNNGQSGREGNWIEAYRRGFEDYKAKLDEAL
jgi:uncharacterized lipoprotein YajG